MGVALWKSVHGIWGMGVSMVLKIWKILTPSPLISPHLTKDPGPDRKETPVDLVALVRGGDSVVISDCAQGGKLRFRTSARKHP